MLAKRIIPCLDVRNGRVVKGQQFKNIVDVDTPERLGKFYSDEGADELVFYDITASSEERKISLDFVEKVAKNINIPFCVGGGVACIEDFYYILRRGADKVSVNSAAVKNPQLIKEASQTFGAQCVVLSVDAKRTALHRNVTCTANQFGDDTSKPDMAWEVYVKGGREGTGIDAIQWIKQAVELGAGEIVVNSIDEDGMKNGYDIELLRLITSQVQVPVIASGGAGKKEDFLEAAKKADVDGILAASVFHYGEIRISELKKYLKDNGVSIRL